MGDKKAGNNIRLLRADEIECRVAAANENGVSLLLYKDARVDQRILDETFGMFGWKRSHQCIDGSLYCTVEIYNEETGEWVAKQDVGGSGEQQKEKSQASDSFKRACFNWGIGRELYTAPFIWVPADRVAIQKRGDKYCCSERFSVNSIEYNAGREITGLVVLDSKRHLVYAMKPGAAAGKAEVPETYGDVKREDNREAAGKKQPAPPAPVSPAQMDALEKELQRTGVAMDAVRERYQIDRPEEMSHEIYRKVMSALAKTKPADAA